MKIIEKIEIKSFRSFGNRKQEKTEISRIEDLNIFSGANDSGKSNILRALNLFFNKNTNLGEFLDFDNDFFKRNNEDENDVKQEMITVKIHFWNEKNKGINQNNENYTRLPERFWVSRKWHRTSEFSSFAQDNGVTISFKKEKKNLFTPFFEEDKKTLKSNVQANLSKQLTDFLSSIQYHYIPAIKDQNYFSYLYGELQQTLLKEENSHVNTNKGLFQESIQKSTIDLMNEFKKSVKEQGENFSSVFELPDLTDLFKTLKVSTGNVNLPYRGDGIQAKFIPEILNFIGKKELEIKPSKLKKGKKPKKYFIWGFEEPENSYEYKNAQLLANKFKDTFTHNAQIFLTTHSFNFLSLEGNNISTYRVWKDEAIESSRITKIVKEQDGQFKFEGKEFENHSDRLNKELGVFQLNQDLEKLFIEAENKRLEFIKKTKELKDELNEHKPLKIFICEDENGITIWRKFFEKYQINDVKVLSSKGCTNDVVEKWISVKNQEDSSYCPLVFRSLDRDGWTNKQVAFLEKKLGEKNKKKAKMKNYKLCFLPVNEIENFVVLVDDFFSEDIINNSLEKLEDAFNGTVQSNLSQSKFSSEDLFRHSNRGVIQGQMLRIAKKNVKKFLPGKDLVKLKENFNANRYLLNLQIENYPKELSEYLNKIKEFFSDSSI